MPGRGHQLLGRISLRNFIITDSKEGRPRSNWRSQKRSLTYSKREGSIKEREKHELGNLGRKSLAGKIRKLRGQGSESFGGERDRPSKKGGEYHFDPDI